MRLNSEQLRERIEPLFRENFSRFGELGAAVSIWQSGEPILELYAGFRDRKREQPWNADTIAPVWSATKGIGSACLLHALHENKVKIERRVSEFWPEFGQKGKADITLAQLLSHSAGICALDQNAEVTDYPAVIRALENQEPLWSAGSAHGYHARTFGFLIDELTRRIGGISISKYWRTIFAEPLSLDFWIGLPENLNSRCASIYPAKAGIPPEPFKFYKDLLTPGTLQRRTFTSPSGLNAVGEMNKPENRARDFVSFGGIGSASALARFYAILANGGENGSRRFFGAESINVMMTTISDGLDRVFEIPTAFSAGFMKDSASVDRKIFGSSTNAFGHPGAGGSHAFADPENKISFAYVMNQMEQSVMPNEKSLRLLDAVYL